MHANRVDLAGLDDLEATVAVILVITRPGKRRANPSMDVGVIGEQPLLRSMIEVGAMVNARLMRRRSTEDLGLPSVPVLR